MRPGDTEGLTFDPPLRGVRAYRMLRKSFPWLTRRDALKAAAKGVTRVEIREEAA